MWMWARSAIEAGSSGVRSHAPVTTSTRNSSVVAGSGGICVKPAAARTLWTAGSTRSTWKRSQDERLNGMSTFARSLHKDGHLRSGISENEARDVLWAYNSAELFKLLVIERGWSPRRYGQWIAEALTAALLP